MLKGNNDTRVRMNILELTPGVSFYINYIGLIYGWHYTEGSESPPLEDPVDPGPLSPDFIYTDSGLKGTFGVIGFFGLIAVPGITIWRYRDGQIDNRTTTFVYAIVGTMMCFAMVLYAIS